jgi:MFS family permease
VIVLNTAPIRHVLRDAIYYRFENIIEICLILAFVRLTGLLIFRFMPGKEEPYKETNKTKYTSILSNKSFILYFIPWLMFTLVNYMTTPILHKIFPNDTFLMILENVVIAMFAVFSGFIADKWGRKRLTIIGFFMLGIWYAVIGFFYSLFPKDPVYLALGSYIYTAADGIAWGIFYVLFIFTLWGDLEQNRNSDKLYFLGALPYTSSYFMQLLFTTPLSIIPATTIFTFASFFLFLAVLPLVYAPETLPEKLMKDRDLKSYVEKAKQRAQKEAAKDDKTRKSEASSVEEKSKDKPLESGEGKEYDDAVKLAEKYY